MRLLLPLLLAATLAADDRSADWRAAHALARTGEYAKAEEMLEQVVSAAPNEVRAWIDLAQIHALRGHAAVAAKALERGLAALPDDPTLTTARAELLLADGKEDDALPLLDAVVAKDPTRLHARCLRDRLWLDHGKRDEAEADLEGFYQRYNEVESMTSDELVDVARGLWISATRKGEKATQKKVADGSAGILVDATRLDPENVDAHLLWGDCYLEKHDADAARAAFNAALKINPHHPDAHVGLAGCAWEEGRLDLAETCARRALTCDPTRAGAHLFLARVAAERGDDAALAAALAAAPEHVRSSPDAITLEAARAWIRGDADAFSDAARRYATARTAGAGLYLFVGDLLSRRLRFAEAQTLYAKAEEADPHEARAAVGLALALLRAGDEEKGRRALEVAYARDPFNLWAKSTTEFFTTVRDEYVSTDTMHVSVRCHTDEANLLSAYVPPMAEGTWQWLADHVGMEGPSPLRIDVVPSVAQFQQRTVGLPWARPPVAALGNVVVVLSPNTANRKRVGPYSWSHAVRSGIAQAWLLHGSEGRIPLPMLAGLAESILPSPPAWPVEVLRAMDAGRLPPREDLLAGVPRREDALLVGAARAAGGTIGAKGVKGFLESCRAGHADVADYPGKLPDRRPGRLRIPTDPRTEAALRASLTGQAADAEPLARLAEVALGDGRAAEAGELARKSLDLAPKQPLALRVSADALRVEGKWAEAKAAYEAAIAAGADDAETWLTLADACGKLGGEGRRDALTKARDRCPEWTGEKSPHEQLAAACEEAKDAPGLADALDAWSKAAPESDDVALRLARARLATGRKEEAFAAYERGIEADLLDLKAHVEIGDLAMDLGHADRALTAFGTSVLLLEGLNKDHRYDRPLAGLLVKRAGARLALGKKDECRSDLHRALAIDPTNPEAEKMLRTVGE